MKFRLLKESEIECRVKQCTEKGAVLLLYKDARTDMNILDEAVGAEFWESDYKEIKGNLYCGIGIWSNARNAMIWKWDCGIESREDGDGNQKKGEASDAFKRAGFKWGIGRELYSAPFIFIRPDMVNIIRGERKCVTYDTFSIEKIAYDEDCKISGIAIRNDKTGKRCFVWQKQ